MKVRLNGQDHGQIAIIPDTTIGILKQYFNQHFPNHTIKLTFNNGQELSPVVWDTNQYDTMNFQSHGTVLNGGIIELRTLNPDKTDPKITINQANNTTMDLKITMEPIKTNNTTMDPTKPTMEPIKPTMDSTNPTNPTNPINTNKTLQSYMNFVQSSDQASIDTWLSELDTLFFTKGTPAMTDDFYDGLVAIYKTRFGPRKVVGAPATSDDVPLPIAMMSLDKVKKHEPKLLKNWVDKNAGPYVAMDKVNGNSGLYEIRNTPNGVITKLYKRGDGYDGPDISRVLPFLNLPVLPFDVLIKGELVVDKADYAPYKGDGKDQYRTNLSMSTGLLNPKNLNANPDHLRLIKFIAFDMVFPKNQDIVLTMSQTLEHLTKYGFRVPFHIKTPTLTMDWLGEFFHRQKEHQTYDVDGIVVIADRPVNYEERLIRTKNPEYGFAYKELGQEYETTVTHIVWKASKHGVLTPVVHVVDTPVGDTGFTIRHPTGHNAKFLQTHGIGVGAKIVVVMNTIPDIVRTVEGYKVEPALPPVDKYPSGSWEWNETGVEIVLKHLSREVQIAKLYEFFKKDKINAKGWGEKTVEKLFSAGYNTLKKLLETDKAGFMEVPIEGIGEKGLDNLIRSRDLALPNASLATIMAGTTTFGHGIGKRMIQKVIDVYPNILDFNPSLEQIMAIEGFADITAQKFVDGLPKFKVFIADIPILQRAARGKLVAVGGIGSPPKPGKAAAIAPIGTPTGESLAGKVVMFTGFRDAQLEAAIKAAGGSVKGSGGVTKKVNYVISDGPKGKGSSKEKKAIQYGIPTPDIATFKGMFGI